MKRLPAIVAFAIIAACSGAAVSAQPRSCTTPEYRQFDFWIGDWDVFERGTSRKAADVVVKTDLQGCAITEEYRDESGLLGKSTSSYDSRTKTWQQTWTTNHGELLVVHGTLRGGVMTLEGWLHSGTAESLVRAIWAPEPDGVHHAAERSADGGKTWTSWFDLSFRPRARHGTP